jgi:cyclopropane fatty-acyl-phospholipid synthase-like methyltransferase
VADADPSHESAGTTGDDETMYGWRVRSVRRALAERGLSAGELTVEDLTALGHLDQYHYFGPAACDEAARILGLGGEGTDGPGDSAADRRRLLDVGSGVGGPARYLAATTGCAVHGVELRAELVDLARELTDRAGLADRVRYTVDDAATVDLPAGAYDHAVAWLVLLHLPDRAPALERVQRAVRPGGTVLVEEFALGDPTPEQERALREVVDAPNVVGSEVFADEFRAAGFTDVTTCDLTDAWTAWTAARYDRFRERREEFVAVHGAETYESRASFYRTIRDLFADGAVEGVRVTARVPADETAAPPEPLPLHDPDDARLAECDLAGILEGDRD